jgi:hypothetical protein
MLTFNIYKFVEDCKKIEVSEKDLIRYLNDWALSSDGKTQKELEDDGFLINNNWCIENNNH